MALDISFFIFSLITSWFYPSKTTVVPTIKEASGIADCYTASGYLWVIEDSGHPPEMYVLAHDGKVLKKVYIKGAVNHDWEDMARVEDELYIADIGDNTESRSDYTVYQFKEPDLATDTINTFHTIHFQYEDGAHNAEAFLVDPLTKDIFIVTKKDNPSRIYKLAYPYQLATMNTARMVGVLSYRGVTAAAISDNGKEVIIKTYFGLKHYCRLPGETVEEALQTDFTRIPYLFEPQGEAIAFAHHTTGFFTLSEKSFAKKIKLRFYKKNDTKQNTPLTKSGFVTF